MGFTRNCRIPNGRLWWTVERVSGAPYSESSSCCRFSGSKIGVASGLQTRRIQGGSEDRPCPGLSGVLERPRGALDQLASHRLGLGAEQLVAGELGESGPVRQAS